MNKAKLDVLIAMVREYWANEDTSMDGVRKRLGRMRDYQESELPHEKKLIEFLQVILGNEGINPRAENDDIYNALAYLGKEVK